MVRDSARFAHRVASEWGQKRLRREKIVVNSREEQSRRNSMAGFGHPIPGPGEVGVE
jgi:hypothetical protein